MLQIQGFTFNPFEENTYVIYDDETSECLIVDPGCQTRMEIDQLTGFIAMEKLKVKALINTHCHIDHVLGNYALKEHYSAPLWIHRIEEPYLRAVRSYAPNYGFASYSEALPDAYIDESEFVTIGKYKLEVLFVPGHSPGHIALYSQDAGALISGDVLFRNSIGRTDLPGGDYDTLIHSIQYKLFQLPDDTRVFSGHGPETTIGFEKRTNPFCGAER